MENFKRKLLGTLFLLILGITFYSCSAVQFGGDIIRSGQKDFEATFTPGITKSDLTLLNNPVLAVNGISPNGQVVIGYLPGSSNANIYADMFMMELMKKGIIVSTLNEGTADVMINQKFEKLDSNGNQLVLIVNTNLASSSSVTEFATGGEWGKVGVTSFTIKGIRTNDNKTLFIAAGNYGKAKDASVVAKDIAFVLENVFKGNLEKLKDPE